MQSITEFLKSMDSEDGTLMKAWEKHRTKRNKKSAYMIYVDNNRQLISDTYPELDTTKKVRDKCREEWNRIKDEGGKVHEKYEKLSDFYEMYGQEPEVSTPFHLFSLFKRDEVADSNRGMTADEVTHQLKRMWVETEDKDYWNF